MAAKAAQSGAEGIPVNLYSGPCPQQDTGIEYIQVREYGELPGIGQRAPFKAVLAVEDTVSDERQREVADWLVAMGGMYIMVCGQDCESWQQAIRQANLERVPLDDMQPQQFVMITVHMHEKLRGIYRYASKHARHTHLKLDNLFTVHVANQNRELEYQNLFSKR